MKELKIWIVNEILNNDGEWIFASHPFVTEDKAKEFIKNYKKKLDEEEGKFQGFVQEIEDDDDSNYEVDYDTDTHFLIYTPSDDYSVELEINVHTISIKR